MNYKPGKCKFLNEDWFLELKSGGRKIIILTFNRLINNITRHDKESVGLGTVWSRCGGVTEVLYP